MRPRAISDHAMWQSCAMPFASLSCLVRYNCTIGLPAYYSRRLDQVSFSLWHSKHTPSKRNCVQIQIVFKSMKKSMKCMKCLWSAPQESKDLCNNVLKPLLQTVGPSDSPWRRREVPAFGVRTDCCLELWHPRMNLLMPFGRSWYVLIYLMCFIGFLLCHKALNDRYDSKRWVGPNEHTIILAPGLFSQRMAWAEYPWLGWSQMLSFPLCRITAVCARAHAHTNTHACTCSLCECIYVSIKDTVFS